MQTNFHAVFKDIQSINMQLDYTSSAAKNNLIECFIFLTEISTLICPYFTAKDSRKADSSTCSPTGHTTLLWRWINIADIDSTSQQHNVPSGQFITSVHFDDPVFEKPNYLRVKFQDIEILPFSQFPT